MKEAQAMLGPFLRPSKTWLSRLSIAQNQRFYASRSSEVPALRATDEVFENGNGKTLGAQRIAGNMALAGEAKVRGASRFRGVSWHRLSKKWYAQAYVNGVQKSLGYYKSEEEAALAYDAEIRSAIVSPLQAKRLNFPTEQEANDLVEALTSPDFEHNRREYNLKTHGKGNLKEALARQIIEQAHRGPAVEMKWLGESAKVHAIARAAGSKTDVWMAVHVRTTLGERSGSFKFKKPITDEDHLLVFVSLGASTVWVIPSTLVAGKTMSITAGGKWDIHRCNLKDLPRRILFHLECSNLAVKPAHFWELPTSQTQLLEFTGCNLFRQMLSSSCLRSRLPWIKYGHHDLVVEGSIRVQLKVTSKDRGNGAYRIQLCKAGGRQGGKNTYRQYENNDFDVLAVVLVEEEHALGLFIMPIKELIQHGAVGRYDKNRGCLFLYPPWSKPTRFAAQAAQALQQQFFIDTSDPKRILSDSEGQRLRTLILSSRRDWQEPQELKLEMLI